MPLNPSSLQSLRRVFHDGFSAHDVTEALISCSESDSAVQMRAFMESRGLEVLGVRREGIVVGYVERASLCEGDCSLYLRPFDPEQTILNSTPIADVILKLKDYPRLFVQVFGQVGGIVTRTDLQKPPVRMWLFGMVTLIEMRMTRMIELVSQDDDWVCFVSEGRLGKAKELLAERKRRQQDLGLLSCLQFSDKCQIIARDERLRSQTRYESRRRVEEAGKRLERLRNNLAHSQDIVSGDWEAVLDLSENLDQLLAGSVRGHESE